MIDTLFDSILWIAPHRISPTHMTKFVALNLRSVFLVVYRSTAMRHQCRSCTAMTLSHVCIWWPARNEHIVNCSLTLCCFMHLRGIRHTGRLWASWMNRNIHSLFLPHQTLPIAVINRKDWAASLQNLHNSKGGKTLSKNVSSNYSIILVCHHVLLHLSI